MQVGVRALRHVVVHNNVDPLDIHASSKEVGGHHDAFVETLEGLVLGQPGWRGNSAHRKYKIKIKKPPRISVFSPSLMFLYYKP